MEDLATAAVLTIGLTAIAAYLLGSIPFGVIVTRIGGAGDVRAIGSGNIGATNVLRTGRKDLALITLVLDAGKGAAAVLIARALFDNDFTTALAGGAAFVGHLFPVWLIIFFLGRISSLSALVAAAAAPVAAWALGEAVPIIALAAVMAVLIYMRHHENIGRLLRGQEPRFGAKA